MEQFLCSSGSGHLTTPRDSQVTDWQRLRWMLLWSLLGNEHSASLVGKKVVVEAPVSSKIYQFLDIAASERFILADHCNGVKMVVHPLVYNPTLSLV